MSRREAYGLGKDQAHPEMEGGGFKRLVELLRQHGIPAEGLQLSGATRVVQTGVE